MKKFTIAILTFLLSFVVYSQTIIEQPKHGLSTAPNATIKKIEIGETATVLYFHTTYTPGNWISIPKKTYIQPINDSIKFYIVTTEGIPLGEKYTMPESGEVDYKLIFPKIDPAVSKLDYGEANDGGSWFIYDIQLKPSLNQSIAPKEILGNWFNKESGDWELSFFDTLAIYKKKLWRYGDLKLKGAEGSIALKNKTTKIELFIKQGTKGTYLIGESTLQLREYCNDTSRLRLKTPVNDKPFETSVFKSDSTTYSGFLKGYTPRIGMKTGTIYVNDIITGEQNSFVVRLLSDGSFSIKLPLYYPHEVYIRSAIYNGSVFLEPGKEVFQMFDTGNDKNKYLFMGDCARINTDLLQLHKISSFNYLDMQKKILDMTPVMYKAYCMDQKQKDLDALEAYKKDHSVSAKASQVKILDIEYRNACNIMSYNMNFEGAYRIKNKIPNTQRTIPVKTEKLTADYYDFLTNELVNNPLAVLSNDYNIFINRLKYLEILRGQLKVYSILEIAIELEKTGYSLSDEEKKLVNALKEKEIQESKAPELDLNSIYNTPKDLTHPNEPLKWNYEGIGISFKILTDTILVIGTKAGGPSEKVGLMASDKIIYINDSLVAGEGISYENVMRMLKGPGGTNVKIMVIRHGHKDLMPFDIIREKMPIYSVDVANMEFNEKYGLQTSEFYEKYTDKMKDLIKEKKGEFVTITMIEKFLIEKGVKFTDDEKELITALKANENTETSIKRREFQKQYKSWIDKFNSDHRSFISNFMNRQTNMVRNENLEKMLGVQKGFATDIMKAQDECRHIVAEVTPVSDNDLQTIQQQISTPFIAEYIGSCNRETKAKIEANKNKKGYIVNEVPKTEADQLFEGLMKKYRGKVVYVDFWATWCGPCRSGIEQIKQLKEEMANKNVVFVYITNPTSPKQTWENMIPDIKGEHFRVSSDEWNYLSGKFNISGIPHSVLVDKNGVVINPHLSYMDNQSLKILLEKHINK